MGSESKISETSNLTSASRTRECDCEFKKPDYWTRLALTTDRTYILSCWGRFDNDDSRDRDSSGVERAAVAANNARLPLSVH